jgi:hypothetical protein
MKFVRIARPSGCQKWSEKGVPSSTDRRRVPCGDRAIREIFFRCSNAKVNDLLLLLERRYTEGLLDEVEVGDPVADRTQQSGSILDKHEIALLVDSAHKIGELTVSDTLDKERKKETWKSDFIEAACANGMALRSRSTNFLLTKISVNLQSIPDHSRPCPPLTTVYHVTRIFA